MIPFSVYDAAGGSRADGKLAAVRIYPTAAFVLGGGVRGGRMLGDWPGLSEKALYQGRDLMPANDLRSLFKGVLAGQWGLASADLDHAVFPGSADARAYADLIV